MKLDINKLYMNRDNEDNSLSVDIEIEQEELINNKIKLAEVKIKRQENSTYHPKNKKF